MYKLFYVRKPNHFYAATTLIDVFVGGMFEFLPGFKSLMRQTHKDL